MKTGTRFPTRGPDRWVLRAQKKTMMGVELPPAMGMATWINVQSAGIGRVAASGDFVALHNHMLHGTPALYFMHFWAEDTSANVAAGLQAAVDLLAK